MGAAGVVGSTTACFLTNTTPSAPINGGFAAFFYGAATPPRLRRGIFCSWRRDGINQIACGKAGRVSLPRSEIPRWIEAALISQSPCDLRRVCGNRFPRDDAFAPPEEVRHVTAVRDGVPSDQPGTRLLHLEDQVPFPRLRSVDARFTAAEPDHPDLPVLRSVNSRRNRAGKTGAKIWRKF